MGPWPIEEVFFAPVLVLAMAALAPIASARSLYALLVGRGASDGDAGLARLAQFRRAAFIVGLGQVWGAAVLAQASIGPALASTPWSALLPPLAAMVAFCAGGVGRLVESDARMTRGAIAAAVTLRLRMLAFLAGPLVVIELAHRLPRVGADGALRYEMLGLAMALIALGIAYGGLLSSVLLGALRRATDPVVAMAREVAAREGVRLVAVLRLPTSAGSRFANAAAFPWARTMVVTDRIVELLEPDELRAVLAHEAGHLSEPAWVGAARIAIATLLVWTLGIALPIAVAASPEHGLALSAGALAGALTMLVAWLRVARRLEHRADDRAIETVGGPPLASALSKLAALARAPSASTGIFRTHPDLHDRLARCGVEVGPRPPRVSTRLGALVGVLVLIGLGSVVALTERVTRVDDPAHTSEARAWWRLRVDAWDADAMLALGWSAARDGRAQTARAWHHESERVTGTRAETLELASEIAALEGECERAEALFDAALDERARRRFDADPFAPLPLGDYTLPPTLVRECRAAVEQRDERDATRP